MFETVINILARVIEGVAALLIVGAVVAGVIDLVACFWREGFQGRTAGTRLRLAERLVHSIEFLIAADILKTIVTPTLERIGLVAGVILIRTVPSLSIAYELRGADGKEPAGPKPQHPVSANPATERGRSPEIEPGNFRGEGEELRSYIHKPSENAHPPRRFHPSISNQGTLT